MSASISSAPHTHSLPTDFVDEKQSISQPQLSHPTDSIDEKQAALLNQKPDLLSSSASSTSTPPINSSSSESSSSNISSFLSRARTSISSLSAYPTSIICSGCAASLVVPPSLWTWSCLQHHVNDRTDKHCMECKQERGNLNPPQVHCSSCGIWSSVPESEAINVIQNKTKQVAALMKTESSIPQQFHCSNCNALLCAPTGNWVCQSCSTSHPAQIFKCTTCSQQKLDQRVLCGNCKQSTSVPSMKLIDRAKSLVHSAAKKSEETLYWATGVAAVNCPTCHSAVKLPKEMREKKEEMEREARKKNQNEGAAGGNVGAGSNWSELEGSSVKPTTPTATPPPTSTPRWSVQLHCDSCNNNFTLMSESKASEIALPVDAKITRQELGVGAHQILDTVAPNMPIQQ